MFPIRESSRIILTAVAALLIATQFVYFSISWLSLNNKNVNHIPTEEISVVEGLKDHWELLTYDIPMTNEKFDSLAQRYHADADYLDYIVQVEKIFSLEPCELLALIASESGFKPQTRMDGGSLSYSTTQMKMPTAKTAYMAITEYYGMLIPYPTHELLVNDKYYAAFLAGGYLRYLHDTYNNKYESYTAYNWGIGGRMIFYNKNGHFYSPYAVKVADLSESFQRYVGRDYFNKTNYGHSLIAANYLNSQIS